MSDGRPSFIFGTSGGSSASCFPNRTQSSRLDAFPRHCLSHSSAPPNNSPDSLFPNMARHVISHETVRPSSMWSDVPDLSLPDFFVAPNSLALDNADSLTGLSSRDNSPPRFPRRLSSHQSSDISPVERRLRIPSDSRQTINSDVFRNSDLNGDRSPYINRRQSQLSDALLLGGTRDAADPHFELFGRHSFEKSSSSSQREPLFDSFCSQKDSSFSQPSNGLPSLSRLLGPARPPRLRQQNRCSDSYDQRRPKDTEDLWDMPPPFQPPQSQPPPFQPPSPTHLLQRYHEDTNPASSAEDSSLLRPARNRQSSKFTDHSDHPLQTTYTVSEMLSLSTSHARHPTSSQYPQVVHRQGDNLLKSLQRPQIAVTNGQQRYDPYVSIKTALAGLSSGEYRKGILRVSSGRPDEAYITNTSSPDAPDYLVQSRTHRNRSIHGDTVVFELLDESQWVALDDPFKAIKSALKPAEVREDRGPKERPTVRVVHVLEFGGKDRPYVAVLRPNRMNTTRSTDEENALRITVQDKFVRAMPLDKRIPWILVPVSDVARYQEVPGPLSLNAAYRIQIERWHESSALPLGRIVDYIGDLGDFETEVKVAMVDHGLEEHMTPFCQELEDEAMDIVDRTRNEMSLEINRRVDLRHSFRVMTIDPKTARDLDDAIHIRIIDDSVNPANFEIGVHIADVTHFVHPGSRIDIEARKRCTTVYLPNTNFPMLPRALCDHLCSLNPNEDKLTFSVIFTINSDGSLSKPPWIGRTVIRSSCRFHYGEVQNILSEFHKAETSQGNLFESMNDLSHPEVHCGNQWRDVWQDLVLLESITQRIRQKRFMNGSLLLHQSRLIANEEFLFDEGGDKGEADLIDDEEADDSNESSHHIIEELMLLANRIVAEKMATSSLSDLAVLRFHPIPPPEKLRDLTQYLQSLGLDPDFSSSGAAHKFLQSVREEFGMIAENAIAQLFMQKMKPADYGVGKYLTDTNHFALSFNLYTHFTSPIRRYADIMVHRVLSAVLVGPDDAVQNLHLDAQLLDQQCALCNEIRLNAKYASDECAVAFFCVWLKERGLLYPTLGTVLNIQDQSMIVYLPKLGSSKRIFFNNILPSSNNGSGSKSNSESSTILDQISPQMLAKIELPSSMTIRNSHTVEIVWKTKAGDKQRIRQIVRSLCPVPVFVVTLQKTPVDFAVIAIPPYDPRYRETIIKSNLMSMAQKIQANDALEMGLQKCYVDLPGCRPPVTDEQLETLSDTERLCSPKSRPTKKTDGAVDAHAAKRIVGFHTAQRGRYREHSKSN